MTAVEWDEVGKRFFETGLDRGVLITVDGTAVPWNGLTQITETVGREIKSYYMDGMKYLDHHVPGSYAAKLEAFTYPDILDELTGVMAFAPGVFLHDQTAHVFHLSYRTGVGNDVDSELGYKLHIVYNVMASPSDAAMSTRGAEVDPSKFSWDLTGTPEPMFGARPTSHISLHSTTIDPELLTTIEGLIYGTADAEPALPRMVDLLALIESFG